MVISADTRIEETIATYDAGAGIYARRYSDVDLSRDTDRFLASLPESALPVLDAGCGAGRDLARLHAHGLRVIGLDKSSRMLSLCPKLEGIELVNGDLRWLPFEDGSIRGVWYCASLLHLTLEGAQQSLLEVHRVLQLGGSLFLATAHGKGSEWRTGFPGGRRWIQYYAREDLERIATVAGLRVEWVAVERGIEHGEWVNLLATRET
jgi:SAM-dependent methyltransferase